ncbi:MAG: hypothetical protein GY880_32815 [Planctomycetaceae bacterium]|nr:hypothetical protein [Planctomycetaceae bacterium]MCP4779023.1 hypothetical protein [Planctomycetaceae bacterium]
MRNLKTLITFATLSLVLIGLSQAQENSAYTSVISFAKAPTAQDLIVIEEEAELTEIPCDACELTTTNARMSFGNGKHMQRWKKVHAKAKEHAATVTARNNAWPKPFDCADRQLYTSMWTPMIDKGFEEQCVLTSNHFDPITGKLNTFGNHTVAGIMNNMPQARRTVFIHRDTDNQLNQKRMNMVKETINTFYGTNKLARIEFSNELPVKLRGAEAEKITELWYAGKPAPIIPIASGTESLDATVTNN